MNISQHLIEFVDSTTFHGYRYLFGEHRSLIRRLLWFLFLAACTALLVFQVSDRIQYYYKWPTIVDNRMISNVTMAFPAVTFCNLNTYKITEAGDNSYMAVIDLLTGETLGIPQSYDKRAVYQIIQRHPATLTMEELMLNTAHKKEEFILQCKWLESPCSHENFTMILTKSGVCYTFNGNADESITTNSPGKGLELVLNVETYQYMVGDNAGAGIRLLTHDKNVYPSVYELGHEISTDTDTRVDIKYTDVQTMETPYGDCGHAELKYLNNTYTIAACKMECLSEHVFDACGCKDAYMPGPFPVCFVIDMACVHGVLEGISEIECDCPPPCREARYEPSFSYASLSDYAVKQMHDNLDIEGIQQTLLNAMISYQVNVARDPETKSLDYLLLRIMRDGFYREGIGTLNTIQLQILQIQLDLESICYVENPQNWINVADNTSIQLQDRVISPLLLDFANVRTVLSLCVKLTRNGAQEDESSANINQSLPLMAVDKLLTNIQDISSSYAAIIRSYNDAIIHPHDTIPDFMQTFSRLRESLVNFNDKITKGQGNYSLNIQYIDDHVSECLHSIQITKKILHNRIQEMKTSVVAEDCARMKTDVVRIFNLITKCTLKLTSFMKQADETLEKISGMQLTLSTSSDDFEAIDLFLENANDDILFSRFHSSLDYWADMLNITISEFLQTELTLHVDINDTKQVFESLKYMTEKVGSVIGTFRNIYYNWLISLEKSRKQTIIDATFYRKNFIHLRLAFHEMSYRRVVQTDSYGVFALLSDIGGSMGLLIGGSVVSIFELLDILFVIAMLYFSGKVRPKIPKQQPETPV